MGNLTEQGHLRHNRLDRMIDNSMVMAYRGLIKVRRTPEQLVDVTLQPVLFVVMFSYIFGGAVAGNVRNYLPLLIPGILVQTLLTAATVTGAQLREDMDKGVFNRFKSLPIARISPLAGALMADVIRYVIATSVTFATGLAMGYRPYGGLFGMSVAGLLVIFVAWSLSWIFAFFGVIAKSASSFTGFSMLILMPLTFLSNAYVPVSSFPRFMRWFVNMNPVTHLISAVRQLTNHGAITVDFWWSLLGSLLFIGLFVPLTLRAYMNKT